MEASTLARATRGGLLARRSPLLRFEGDERLIALIRAGHDGAFEVLFNRYHSRLLGFCQSMLKSRQDAEDVLQEVFANAHAAMLNDERAINVRPWLYRIARNRCLNHLRKPVPEGQDTMDVHPHQNGTTTAEQVQSREDLRQLLADVGTLPETQRSALLLREIDQLTYEEIAHAMDTTVPAVKSLLVRARIALAESSQARLLTCEEVQVELAEAAEGLTKASGPARKHVRDCETCHVFRDQLRSDRRSLAALFPLGPLALLKGGLLSKFFGGGAAGSGTAAGGGAVGGASAAGGLTGGLGLLGGALGSKAAAGVATAALITAGAVEVRNLGDSGEPVEPTTSSAASAPIAPVSPVVTVDRVDHHPAPAAHADREPQLTQATAAPTAEAPAREPVAESEEEAPPAEETAAPPADAAAEPTDAPGEVAIGVDPPEGADPATEDAPTLDSPPAAPEEPPTEISTAPPVGEPAPAPEPTPAPVEPPVPPAPVTPDPAGTPAP